MRQIYQNSTYLQRQKIYSAKKTTLRLKYILNHVQCTAMAHFTTNCKDTLGRFNKSHVLPLNNKLATDKFQQTIQRVTKHKNEY